ncbi:MAG: Glutathione synthase/Ribosomal protein modification enzyme (glutaminyl transferase)-like protein [Bacillales bacterium]|nr:Glutathione synthase/Ribosomal protein modification enzyme (glutaminyl transferase)-like protein [Bacillales bacterium]
MWIKIEMVEDVSSEPVVWLPKSLFEKTGKTAIMNFGLRKVFVKINKLENGLANLGKKFDHPFTISLSKSIVDKLLIKLSNTYQIKISHSKISLGPVIALLLGEQQYYYHNRAMGEYTDAMSWYKSTGGLICAFKACSINWDEECAYGMFYNHEEHKWDYGKLPLPSVVYRRAYNIPYENVEKLKAATGGKVFNSRRFSKWQMYKQLKNNSLLSQHLPDTKTLKSFDTLNQFLQKYEKIILKPTGLSRGRGICIVEKLSENLWLLSDYHDGTELTQCEFSKQELITYITEAKMTEKNYIIQPYLSLANIDGSPWDIRVVMQKNTQSEWQCHGIECRLAGSGDLVTNISRGGSALPISKALKLSFGSETKTSNIKKEIIDLCKKLASELEKDDDIFAELGVDIAMDNEMNYWIIEANVRPTYNGFKKHMRYNNYLYLCSAPIAFAGYLAGFERGNPHDSES